MKKSFFKSFALLLLSFSCSSYASSLSEDAIVRGISSTCSSYLSQIEKSYNLNGLKITFAHPKRPSELPSLHISSQSYNNGSSSFSANLIPDDNYCYLSTVLVTVINNQSCLEIAQIKEKNENLQLSSYADGAYIILTPPDNSYQTILTSSGENTCAMTEARMMWPGR
jgi:hypothetical protein